MKVASATQAENVGFLTFAVVVMTATPLLSVKAVPVSTKSPLNVTVTLAPSTAPPGVTKMTPLRQFPDRGSGQSVVGGGGCCCRSDCDTVGAASAAAASKGPAATERSLPAAPIEKPVFQLSAAAAARRDARRGDKKVTGGGGGGGGVRIDFAHGDEDEDGGGEDGNRSGFGGGGKRARNFRKKSAEDD